MSTSPQTPPVVSGALPVLGHVIEFQTDRPRLLKRGFAEHGKVFTIKLGPQPAAVVNGVENNRTFFMETDKSLNIGDSYSFLKALFGEVMFIAGPEAYQNQRPVLQEIFRREKMLFYIDAMYQEVQKWLDSLGDEGEVEITGQMLHLAQYVAGHAFIGPDFREQLDDSFWRLYDDISKSIDFLLPQHLPLPKFIRRDRAKKRINAIVRPLIEERRRNPEKYDDMLQDIVNKPCKDGSLMDNESIVNLVIGLLFAGHETTAGQAAWTIIHLLQHPEYLATVQREINQVAPYGTPIDAKTLAQLDHVYYAIDETTRLAPSAELVMRIVDEPVTIEDYTIPAGWRMVTTAEISHHLEETFSDPESYNPLRFSPEYAEGKNPFSIMGFGGGIHKCTGMNFAKNEMAMIVTLLFRQFDVELVTKNTGIERGLGANRPTKTILRYTRKAASQPAAAGEASEAAGCPYHTQA